MKRGVRNGSASRVQNERTAVVNEDLFMQPSTLSHDDGSTTTIRAAGAVPTMEETKEHKGRSMHIAHKCPGKRNILMVYSFWATIATGFSLLSFYVSVLSTQTTKLTEQRINALKEMEYSTEEVVVNDHKLEKRRQREEPFITKTRQHRHPSQITEKKYRKQRVQSGQSHPRQQHGNKKRHTSFMSLTSSAAIDAPSYPLDDPKRSLAGLTCVDHGGPNNDQVVQDEMVYWREMPSDSAFRRLSGGTSLNNDEMVENELFLTFEPDVGGWNNIRMGLETVLALAVAMGRTLVLPPAQEVYLLGKPSTAIMTGGEASPALKAPQWSFGHHFFDLIALNEKYKGTKIKIITTEEFLERQRQRQAANQTTIVPLPPSNHESNKVDNATAWCEHLRNHATNVIWDPEKCIAYFPPYPGMMDDDALNNLQQKYRKMVRRRLRRQAKKQRKSDEDDDDDDEEDEDEESPPEDSLEKERLADLSAGRTRLCLYTSQLQTEPLLHIPVRIPPESNDPNHQVKVVMPDNVVTNNSQPEGVNKDGAAWSPRLLIHFYAFVFFADLHQELAVKRLIRDHVRYIDEIQCAAARVVVALRRKVQKLRDGHRRQRRLDRDEEATINGLPFHSMHVRRGDFQYNETRISASELYQQVSSVFQPGGVVFIATDEPNKLFFKPLHKHYNVFFLQDFVEEARLDLVDPNYYGMIDQLVAARGKIFFGCWLSTFTGYIHRLRGYHSQYRREPGYQEGILPTSFYYFPDDKIERMTKYHAIAQPMWAQEFPTAWRLLDRDVSIDAAL
ncbi:hypothetical protein ACA910_020979 [Epithemia clementina (nom. ined.)]